LQQVFIPFVDDCVCLIRLGVSLKYLSLCPAHRSVASMWLAAVSLLSSTAIVTPYLVSDARVARTDKASQCRSLFEAVVDTRHLGAGFYPRKVRLLQGLALTDGPLQTVRSQFSDVFSQIDRAQRRRDPATVKRLNHQASQLVNQLNNYCL
jgi:hypothetical protein